MSKMVEVSRTLQVSDRVVVERFGRDDYDLYLDGEFWSEGATLAQVRRFARLVAKEA